METMLESSDLISADEKGKQQLRGIEGKIATIYFGAIRRLFKYPGRKPRGGDPFNNALDYGYGIMYTTMLKYLDMAGMDTSTGFFHTDRYDKLPLLYDMVEEFRVPLVDSAIIPLFREKKFNVKIHAKPVDKGKYWLTEEGTKLVTQAVKHNLFAIAKWYGKSFTIDLIMKDQVRRLANHFYGKEKEYVTFDAEAFLNENE